LSPTKENVTFVRSGNHPSHHASEFKPLNLKLRNNIFKIIRRTNIFFAIGTSELDRQAISHQLRAVLSLSA
jgi:hypothetical protein